MSDSAAHDTKIYVLDTNILLHEPLAFMSFKEHDVVVPMTVLEELDYIKDSKKDVARDARVAIRSMEDVLRDATPEQIISGVSMRGLGSGETAPTGRLSIYSDHGMAQEQQVFTSNENDNRIINAALMLQRDKKSHSVVLVTKDINMRLKAKGAGLENVEDYRTDQLVSDIKFLSKGYFTFDGNFWDKIKSVNSHSEGRDTIHTIERKVLPDAYVNEFLLDETEHFAAIVESVDDEEVDILDISRERLMGRRAWGITPKNIGQGMALHALLDPHIDLIILTGPAGSGKTLLALAAALVQ
jgi:PhoH-like ATPase